MKQCPVHGPINHPNASDLIICPIDGVDALTDLDNGVAYLSSDEAAALDSVALQNPGPSFWGPRMWSHLHEEVRAQAEYDKWYEEIPCTSCKAEVATYESTNTFVENDDWWGFDLHNHVNTNLGKTLMAEAAAQTLYGWGPRDTEGGGEE